MKVRFFFKWISAALALIATSQAKALSAPFNPPPEGSLFSSYEPLKFQLKASLSELFSHKGSGLIEAKKATVQGELSYQDEKQTWVHIPVEIRLKGFSSLQCDFPKMEFKVLSAPASSLFANLKSVDLNTHCSEPDNQKISEFFRRSYWNHREALIYRMMDVLGMPSLRARPVFVRYQDSGTPATQVAKSDQDYQAFFLEDMSAFRKRLNLTEIKEKNDPLRGLVIASGKTEKAHYDFESLKASQNADPEDVYRIALLQSLVGNGDWFLKTTADHYRFRQDESGGGLWNVKVVETGNKKWIFFPQDFSLSAFLIGSPFSPPLDKVYETVDAASQARIKQAFVDRKETFYQLVETLQGDPEGQKNAKSLLDLFYSRIR